MRKPKVGDLVLVKESLNYGDSHLNQLKGKVARVRWVNNSNGQVDVSRASSFVVGPEHYVIVNFYEYYDTLQKMW